MLQRASAPSQQARHDGPEAPPIVHDVLRSPGHALDPAMRGYFESRFNRDFGEVRVHTDARAAESARSVDALAYTVGSDVVFGAGQYAPETSGGRELLAHELTHVVQQEAFPPHGGGSLRLGDPSSNLEREADAAAEHSSLSSVGSSHGPSTVSRGVVQRACIDDPECKPAKPGGKPGTEVKGSATHFSKSVEREEKEKAEKEKKKTPHEIREELCDKVPPDPGCTGDGHGRRAVAFEELFRSFVAAQTKSVTGVFVDKDMPKAYGAYFWDCASFTPKIEGDRCIFIPEHLEDEAALYKKGEKNIKGRSRETWLMRTFSTLTHEFEHARFREKFSKDKPRPEACEFKDVSHELSELAAIMSEFPVRYRALSGKSWSERRDAFDAWFRYKLTQPQKHGETIAGIIKAIRCRCECSDVDAYIKKVTEFVTASWTDDEKNTFHAQLRDPKWKLDWPVETPPPPRDLPGYLLRPRGEIGYGRLGGTGLTLGAGLDIGIPLDRLGKWQLLLGAQGRMISGLTGELQTAYILGLKFGFVRGPALGSKGFEFGLFGETGGGYFSRGLEKSKGAYAGGSLYLGYRGEISEGRIPFIGLEVAGGARIDWSKPAVQQWFVSGVTVSAGVEF